LTGLDVPAFNVSVESLLEIHGMFSRTFSEDAMEPLSPDSFLGYPCINISNHYFTSQQDDPFSTSIPFDEETDPKRVLANLANEHWFHGADNEVVYYHFIPDASPIK
jgi:hypothetical protein